MITTLKFCVSKDGLNFAKSVSHLMNFANATFKFAVDPILIIWLNNILAIFELLIYVDCSFLNQIILKIFYLLKLFR